MGILGRWFFLSLRFTRWASLVSSVQNLGALRALGDGGEGREGMFLESHLHLHLLPALSCNENEAEHLDRDQPYPSSQKTKRMRTSFKHHQLRTMKSYFAINHNPDAKDLKQLAQKTGLTKRVLQVSRDPPVRGAEKVWSMEDGAGGVCSLSRTF